MPPAALKQDKRVNDLLERAAKLRAAGQLAESAVPLRRAARLAPRSPQIQHDLGLTLMNLRDFEPALACFERACALDPAFGAAHFRRGILLELVARPGAAEAYECAIETGFQDPGAYSRLAALWEQEGRRGPAASLYKQAAARAPGSPLAAIDRAQAALIEGDYDTAEPLLRAVLAESPAAGAVRGKLGHVLAARGKFAEAAANFERALRDKPDEVGLFYDLLQLHRVGLNDSETMRRLEAACALSAPPRARLRLRLAVAKAHDDRGEYDLASAALQQADSLRAELSRFDEPALTARTDALLALFTADFLRPPGHLGSGSNLPVLVVGMPRSGTTLVEQIIASHPEAAGAGEVHFWEAEGRALLTSKASPAMPFDLRKLAEEYVARLRRVAPAARRVVDKMPFNFPWAALVHLALPQARIVHCRRHPADTCLSILFADLHASASFSAVRPELLVLYRDYLRVMAHMRAVLPPDRFLELDYEALVAEPEACARRLVAFCGLEWNDACLWPERSGQRVLTASLWQVRQPIYRASVGRWHHYAAWLTEFAALA